MDGPLRKRHRYSISGYARKRNIRKFINAHDVTVTQLISPKGLHVDLLWLIPLRLHAYFDKTRIFASINGSKIQFGVNCYI